LSVTLVRLFDTKKTPLQLALCFLHHVFQKVVSTFWHDALSVAISTAGISKTGTKT
jgi:hypothetical protein